MAAAIMLALEKIDIQVEVEEKGEITRTLSIIITIIITMKKMKGGKESKVLLPVVVVLRTIMNVIMGGGEITLVLVLQEGRRLHMKGHRDIEVTTTTRRHQGNIHQKQAGIRHQSGKAEVEIKITIKDSFLLNVEQETTRKGDSRLRLQAEFLHLPRKNLATST